MLASGRYIDKNEVKKYFFCVSLYSMKKKERKGNSLIQFLDKTNYMHFYCDVKFILFYSVRK